MTEGDVLLAALRQADGALKNRPVVVLRRMPPFNDLLVCGVSSQIKQSAELDEVISVDDDDFQASGLKTTSLIRLGFLAVLRKSEFKGRIGNISASRHTKMLTRLSEFLRPNA